MTIIREPNKKVAAFISTKHPVSDDGWRLSLWAVPFEENGIYLMKHTFSGEIVRLTKEEYTAPDNIEELKQRRFVVPCDYDEAQKYADTVKLMRLMEKKSTGFRTYTILPTTACNARCTYCYEENYAVCTMTRETAERLVDYICETRCDGKITLSWFGGEPLAGASTITYICMELEKRGVPFRSRMISNASLFTPELVREAREVWKLGKIQVSLDGDRRDYAERKRYIDPVRFNYDTVMRAVHMLADEGIRVNLRVNFDNRNIGRLKGFLDEMKAEFGGSRYVSLYLSPLYQEMAKPSIVELEREMYALDGYIRGIGLSYENRSKIRASFRLNYCMADMHDNSIVIHPDGRFFDCEHLPESRSWGNIFDGVTDRTLFESISAPQPIDDGCRKCPYLPQCTPFFRNCCPCWFEMCRGHMELKNEYELRRIADIERNGNI